MKFFRSTIFIFLLLLLFFLVGCRANSQFSTNQTEEIEEDIIQLDFEVDDSVVHTNKPIVYVINKDNQKLYAINYETKEIKSIEFNLRPETLYYRDNKVYVGLSKYGHRELSDDKYQNGAVAIIDTDQFAVNIQFDVEIDPYDMVVDHEGYIYLTNGSGQSSVPFCSYNKIGLRVSCEIIEVFSNLVIDDVNGKMYLVDVNSEFREISFITGRVDLRNTVSYYTKYWLTNQLTLSPDGLYIFNSSGMVFNSSDLKYVNSIFQAYSAITFDTINENTIYVAYDHRIVSYSYNSYKIKDAFIAKQSIRHLFVNLNQLVAVGRNTIEIIDEGKPKQEVPIVEIPKKSSNYDDYDDVVLKEYQSERNPLDFVFTRIIVHPTKPIFFATNINEKKVYSFNYKTKEKYELNLTLPPEGLYYRDEKLYVTLQKVAHEVNYTEKREGAIGIIEVNTMSLIKQIDIDFDPYDLVVDNDGFIYVSSGSGQMTTINSYNTLGILMSSVLSEAKATLRYDYVNHLIYIHEGVYTYRSRLENGKFVNKVELKGIKNHITLSPDGDYIFYGLDGRILNYSSLSTVKNIDLNFTTATFDEQNSHFYTGRNRDILLYDYSDKELLALYKVTGKIVNLYNNNQQLIALTINENNQFFIEIINDDEPLQETANQDDFALDKEINIELLNYNRYTFKMNHTVTDTVMHPSESIVYYISAAEKKIYSYNYETKEMKELGVDNPPVKVTIHDNKLYVLLMGDPFTEVKSYISILNLDTLSMHSSIPFDVTAQNFVIDGNNNIYVSHKSDTVYSITSYNYLGNKIDTISDLNYIKNMEFVGNKLFVHASDYINCSLENGDIVSCKVIPGTPTYPNPYLTINSTLSPDELFIYNGNGYVLNTITNLYNKTNLFEYHLLSFDNGKIYTLNNKNELFVYSLDTHELIGYQELAISDTVVYLHVRNGQVIYLTKNEYNTYKMNVLSLTDGIPIIVEPVEEVVVPAFTDLEGEKIELKTLVTDVVRDPHLPILYIVSASEKKLISINYLTKERNEITFEQVPLELVLYESNIYVKLSNNKIAIIDENSFTYVEDYEFITSTNNLLLDKNTNQLIMNEDGKLLTANGFLTILNPSINKVYDITGARYFYKNNEIINDINKSRDYNKFKISDDGKYLFDYSGTIYYSSNSREDFILRGKIEAYQDIIFDLENDSFYTVNDNKIYHYRYSTLTMIDYAEASGPLTYIFKDKDCFITINISELNDHYIEVLRIDTTIEDPVDVKEPVDPIEVTFTEESIILTHNVKDSTIDESQPIVYIASNMKLYAYNFITKEVKELNFEYPIEKIKCVGNKVFVLMSTSSTIENVRGSVAIINTDTFTVLRQFNINIYSTDFEVDSEGYIYIVSSERVIGRYPLNCYDSNGNLISTINLEEQSEIFKDSNSNRVYAISYGGYNKYFYVYQYDNGIITNSYLNIHSYLEPQLTISPDGRFYFNNKGHIYYTSYIRNEDGLYRHKLSITYTAIAFNLDASEIILTNSAKIYVYDYLTYDLVEYYNLLGNKKAIYTFNNQFILITEVNETYSIKVITKN